MLVTLLLRFTTIVVVQGSRFKVQEGSRRFTKVQEGSTSSSAASGSACGYASCGCIARRTTHRSTRQAPDL